MTEALIIDDNRSTADALGQMLAVLGCKHAWRMDQAPAMSILGSGFVPRIYLPGYQHAGVDGTEILAYLRREPRLIPVPVFVITSDDQPETRRKVMKLGATAMIIKPATIDVLENALKKAKIL